MRRWTTTWAAALCLGALLVSPGCGNDDTPSTSDGYDFTSELEDAVKVVIIPTYAQLKKTAAALHGAALALQKDVSEANLDAARKAWVAARVPWEQSEAFLFGPVADLSLDPALDSWPVDRTQLDQVLSSGLELSAATLSENLGGGLKGFHTIEYLLWGTDHQKSAASLAAAPRELEYLVAATEALSLDAATLHGAWVSDGFGESFYLAGKPGGRYYSQRDAVAQLVNGMIDICDEVANGKIADPFDEQNVTLVESQFSYNSVRDFTDNLRSVQNVYVGTFGAATGAGLSRFVADKSAELDARLRKQLEAALSAIEAISADGQPFRDAVTDPQKKGVIEAAQQAIRTVMTTLQGEVLPLVRGD